ncbi:MAG: hypothetical protein FVQ79_11465 [Planctomycetes bacterium]|nr:hypothetical protein [Planctomycetota bacterium]
MVDEVNSRFLPRSVVMFHAEGKAGRAIEGVSDFIKYQKAIGGKATAYVCENYQCKLPVTDLAGLKKNIDDISMKGWDDAGNSTFGR